MDKLAFVISVGGLVYSFKKIKEPTNLNIGIAVASLVVLSVSVNSMINNQKDGGNIPMLLKK
jgi:hypothetical protein